MWNQQVFLCIMEIICTNLNFKLITDTRFDATKCFSGTVVANWTNVKFIVILAKGVGPMNFLDILQIQQCLQWAIIPEYIDDQSPVLKWLPENIAQDKKKQIQD